MQKEVEKKETTFAATEAALKRKIDLLKGQLETEIGESMTRTTQIQDLELQLSQSTQKLSATEEKLENALRTLRS